MHLKACYRNVLGQHDDARMNLSMAISAVRHGGTLVNYTELVELHKSEDENGKEVVSGATIKDRITGNLLYEPSCEESV